MSGAAVSWNSKLLSTTYLLFTEAKYVACTHAVQEAMWMKMFFEELGLLQAPMSFLCNNQGALALAQNPVNHLQTKHIAL
jgi:hypothetical protein